MGSHGGMRMSNRRGESGHESQMARVRWLERPTAGEEEEARGAEGADAC